MKQDLTIAAALVMVCGAAQAAPLVACLATTFGGVPACVADMGSYANDATGAAFCTGATAPPGHIPLCQANLAAAVADARSYFATSVKGELVNASKTYVIQIPAGVYDLESEKTALSPQGGAIDVSRISPSGTGCLAADGKTTGAISLSGSGCLLLTGAGSGRTTLKTASYLSAVAGLSVSHFMLNGMTLEQPNTTLTQGRVVSSNTIGTATGPNGATLTYTQLVLDISPGFPTPEAMFRRRLVLRDGTLYMRAYANGAAPTPIASTSASPDGLNVQRSWGELYSDFVAVKAVAPTRVDPQNYPARWSLPVQMPIGLAALPAFYVTPPGGPESLVCLKLDTNQALYFVDPAGAGGTDIVISDITFINAARSTFRGISGSLDGTVGGVQIYNSTIARGAAIGGQVPCLSAAGGGMQIGQPKDPPIYGALIYNLAAEATGDDTVAIFNDIGGATIAGQAYPQSRIINASVGNSFVRDFNLFNDQTITSLAISPVLVDAATMAFTNANGNCDPLIIQGDYPGIPGCPVTYTTTRTP